MFGQHKYLLPPKPQARHQAQAHQQEGAWLGHDARFLDVEHETVRARVPCPGVDSGRRVESGERPSVGRAAGKAGAGDVTMRHLDRYPKILEEDGVSACAAGEAPKAGAETRWPG